jgi:hypothetical protein
VAEFEGRDRRGRKSSHFPSLAPPTRLLPLARPRGEGRLAAVGPSFSRWQLKPVRSNRAAPTATGAPLRAVAAGVSQPRDGSTTCCCCCCCEDAAVPLAAGAVPARGLRTVLDERGDVLCATVTRGQRNRTPSRPPLSEPAQGGGGGGCVVATLGSSRGDPKAGCCCLNPFRLPMGPVQPPPSSRAIEQQPAVDPSLLFGRQATLHPLLVVLVAARSEWRQRRPRGKQPAPATKLQR